MDLTVIAYQLVVLMLALAVLVVVDSLRVFIDFVVPAQRPRGKFANGDFADCGSRDNEIKIDAMEQVFASIYSIKKGGLKPFGWFSLQTQPHVSFEIVACNEDIRFYIVVPQKLRIWWRNRFMAVIPERISRW